jgi:hypothetical protein
MDTKIPTWEDFSKEVMSCADDFCDSSEGCSQGWGCPGCWKTAVTEEQFDELPDEDKKRYLNSAKLSI